MASTLSSKPLYILETKLQNCSPPRVLWDCPLWKKLAPSNHQEQWGVLIHLQRGKNLYIRFNFFWTLFEHLYAYIHKLPNTLLAFPFPLLFILFNSPRTCLCHYHQNTVLKLYVFQSPQKTKFLKGRDSSSIHTYWHTPGTYSTLTNFYCTTLP